MRRCENKTVLITGASSGIGQACARELAREGAKLILSGRREEKLQALAAELQQTYHSTVHQLICDVQNRDAVQQALRQLPESFQTIDVLINNAGLALGLDKMHDAQSRDWDQMIDTNIKGVLYMTEYVLPKMLARNAGHVINIGSTAGHHTYPGGSVYCATKYAVNALTKTLSQEVAGTKLRVSEIAPGMVETEFSLIRFKGDQTRAQKVYENITPL
ncbi:MAG TPA: SDR family NAD(P)-dependent oxidoreductase, partial [Gammaproteobacteria bacterium]|nr:SDR family NAD(P)-dependent oxidoreductase [Gammaproteobacteria bacterium]